MSQPEQPGVPGLPAAGTDGKNKLSVMLFGLALLLSGAWFIYEFGYVPWAEANAGAATVHLSFNALLMAPVALVLGLVLLLPLKAGPSAGKAPKPSWWARCVLTAIVLILISGAILYFWLRSFLKARGYEF